MKREREGGKAIGGRKGGKAIGGRKGGKERERNGEEIIERMNWKRPKREEKEGRDKGRKRKRLGKEIKSPIDTDQDGLRYT